MIKVKSTTVCAVLKDGKIAIGADGQATMGNTVAKSNVNKIRTLNEGKILAGFAGCTADAFTLIERFEEKLSNGKKFHTVYLKDYTYQNSDVFTVPKDHYFFLGDNRDCSKDSRYLTSVGYVHKDNLVGKAQFIFFSSDKRIGSFIEFWKWHKSIRFNRTFNKIN